MPEHLQALTDLLANAVYRPASDLDRLRTHGAVRKHFARYIEAEQPGSWPLESPARRGFS